MLLYYLKYLGQFILEEFKPGFEDKERMNAKKQ